MQKLLRISTKLAILLCCNTVVSGQRSIPVFELGANIGTYVYQGDLTPSFEGSFKTPRPGLMLFGTWIFNSCFSLRTNLAFAKIAGDDSKYAEPAWKQQRNFKFSASLIEISELLVWDVLRNRYRKNKMFFSPYLFAGAGIVFLSVHPNTAGFNQEFFADEPRVIEGLATDMKRPVRSAIPVLPIGAGIKFSLNPKISLIAESSYRLTRTDYIDGFSEAANPNRNDQFGSYSLGVIFRLGSSNKMICPPVPR